MTELDVPRAGARRPRYAFWLLASVPVALAVELWLDSPSHRRNMMDAGWKESAIGVAVAEDGSYYFTQVFLKK